MNTTITSTSFVQYAANDGSERHLLQPKEFEAASQTTYENRSFVLIEASVGKAISNFRAYRKFYLWRLQDPRSGKPSVDRLLSPD